MATLLFTTLIIHMLAIQLKKVPGLDLLLHTHTNARTQACTHTHTHTKCLDIFRHVRREIFKDAFFMKGIQGWHCTILQIVKG